ncbi:MAG TPA: YfhO family protein [Puia sp.]|nr:YfhO family protein [Puia sp.]
MTAAYVIRWVRAREYRHLAISAALAFTGFVIGLACNAVVTLTTMDYAKASLRDGSALATAGGSVTKTGLSQAYALSYSMYKTEAFELLVPKIYGGGGPLDAMISQDDSRAIAALQNMPPQAANALQRFLYFYWGGISAGSTGGPAYAGAIICLLALLGFFLLDGKHKWWILAASILAIFMSWGSYFVDFNGFLLKVLPGYDKFRAPSVAIVIPNFLFCWLAILVLDKLLKLSPADRAQTWQQYKKGLYLTGGVFVVLLVCYFGFDYTGQSDAQLLKIAAAQQSQVQEVIHSYLHDMRTDRQSIFFNSLVRSFLFILIAALLGIAWIKGRIKPLLALGLIGGLAVIDILTLDTLYMNSDNYRDIEEAQTPFTATPADQAIMKDTGYYRVFDLRQGAGAAITNLATAAWFHRTVAGYHPAKLSIYEDLLENQLEKYPDCQPTVDMLNAKYLLLPTADGRGDSAALNPGALGPVWFVRGIRSAATPRALMDDLTTLDTKDTALVFSDDHAAATISNTPADGDTIYLTHNDNDEMTYRSVTKNPRFAVFSEVYYDRGWHALIDGTETPIVRTDYALRGLAIPAGKHNITFIFHPASYYTGRVIQVVASILLFALLILAGVREWRMIRKE